MHQQNAARVARVSKADAISVAGGLYQPLRRELGVRAFGINAFFASSAGDQLIEPHDETGSGSGGHAELYLIVAGRASLVVGGSEIDAPAGSSSSFLPRRLDERPVRSKTTPLPS